MSLRTTQMIEYCVDRDDHGWYIVKRFRTPEGDYAFDNFSYLNKRGEWIKDSVLEITEASFASRREVIGRLKKLCPNIRKAKISIYHRDMFVEE